MQATIRRLTHKQAEAADDREIMALSPNQRLKIVESCVLAFLGRPEKPCLRYSESSSHL